MLWREREPGSIPFIPLNPAAFGPGTSLLLRCQGPNKKDQRFQPGDAISSFRSVARLTGVIR